MSVGDVRTGACGRDGSREEKRTRLERREVELGGTGNSKSARPDDDRTVNNRSRRRVRTRTPGQAASENTGK